MIYFGVEGSADLGVDGEVPQTPDPEKPAQRLPLGETQIRGQSASGGVARTRPPWAAGRG
jgi:hypothetical protein